MEEMPTLPISVNENMAINALASTECLLTKGCSQLASLSVNQPASYPASQQTSEPASQPASQPTS